MTYTENLQDCAMYCLNWLTDKLTDVQKLEANGILNYNLNTIDFELTLSDKLIKEYWEYYPYEDLFVKILRIKRLFPHYTIKLTDQVNWKNLEWSNEDTFEWFLTKSVWNISEFINSILPEKETVRVSNSTIRVIQSVLSGVPHFYNDSSIAMWEYILARFTESEDLDIETVSDNLPDYILQIATYVQNITCEEQE